MPIIVLKDLILKGNSIMGKEIVLRNLSSSESVACCALDGVNRESCDSASCPRKLGYSRS